MSWITGNRASAVHARAMEERDRQIARETREENRAMYCPVIHHLPANLMLRELMDRLEIERCNLDHARKCIGKYGDSSSRKYYRRVSEKIEILSFRIKGLESVAC